MPREAFPVDLTSDEVENIMSGLAGYADYLISGATDDPGWDSLRARAAQLRTLRDTICERWTGAKVEHDLAEMKARIGQQS